MTRTTRFWAPWLLMPAAFAAVAAWSPSEPSVWFERIWTFALLLAAIVGFAGPERLLQTGRLSAEAFHPQPFPLQRRRNLAARSLAFGASIGILSSASAALVADFTPAEATFLACYGMIAGLAVAAHMWSCVTVSAHSALRLWSVSDAGRRAALTLLQTPFVSVALLAASGLLLLLASLAMQEPERLTATYVLTSSPPRSMVVGLVLSCGPLVGFAVWSIRTWALQGGRMTVAARTARAQLVFGERPLRFEADDSASGTPGEVLQRVLALTLHRGLPPAMGIGIALALSGNGLAVFSTTPVFDALVVWAAPLWFFTVARIPERAQELASAAWDVSGLLSKQRLSADYSNSSARWCVRQMAPALIVAPLFAGTAPALWQLSCSVVALTCVVVFPRRAPRILVFSAPVAACVSVLITYV